MKRIAIILLGALSLYGCENQQSSKNTVVTEGDSVELQTQQEFIKSWQDQGVDNFSFDEDGYLVYKVRRSEVSADPNWVAKQHFDMAYVDEIKGCRIVDENGVEFGRYEP